MKSVIRACQCVSRNSHVRVERHPQKCPFESKKKGEECLQPAGRQGQVWDSAGQPAEEMVEGPAKAEGPSKMEVFVPSAMGDVSAAEAYEETHCPHDTWGLAAFLPPCRLVLWCHTFVLNSASHGPHPTVPYVRDWTSLPRAELRAWPFCFIKTMVFSASEPPAQCP